jgi:hypothetical protein
MAGTQRRAPFRSRRGCCLSNRRLARNRFQVWTQSDPCISSVATAIMITTSNSSLSRSGTPNQFLGALLHTIAISGLSRARTELDPLRAIPSLTPHPIQTNRQLAGATLAVFRPRRIIRWRYLLRHSGTLRTVACAAMFWFSRTHRRSWKFPSTHPSKPRLKTTPNE